MSVFPPSITSFHDPSFFFSSLHSSYFFLCFLVAAFLSSQLLPPSLPLLCEEFRFSRLTNTVSTNSSYFSFSLHLSLLTFPRTFCPVLFCSVHSFRTIFSAGQILFSFINFSSFLLIVSFLIASLLSSL